MEKCQMIYHKKLLAIITCVVLAFVSAILSSCIKTGDEEAPSKEQAIETVTSFLEMCRQGKIEEAAQKYIDNSDIGRGIGIFPISVDKIISYMVDSKVSAVGNYKGIPPARIVLAEVQINDTEFVGLGFFCSEDGRRIFQIGISEEDVTLPSHGD